jgi:hypothetical protein
MGTMGLMENGLRRRKRRRRRNPTAAAKSTVRKSNPAVRRSTSLTSVKSYAKRNGLVLRKAGSIVANPRRRKHHKRRNGLQTASSWGRQANGLLGNTKQDAKTVGTLLGGAALTKIVGRFISSFGASYLAQFGVGSYGEIICDGLAAVLITPYLIGMVLKGGDVAKQARIGGLLVVGLDVIQVFAPSALQYNPFNVSPVVMTGAGAAITPAAAAAIAQGVAASPNPTAAAAKVAGILSQATGTAGAMGGSSYMIRKPALVL